MQLRIPTQTGDRGVNVRIDQSGDHGAAVQIDDTAFPSSQYAHFAVAADADNASVFDRQRFLDRKVPVDGNDFSAAKNYIRRLRHRQRAGKVDFHVARATRQEKKQCYELKLIEVIHACFLEVSRFYSGAIPFASLDRDYRRLFQNRIREAQAFRLRCVNHCSYSPEKFSEQSAIST